MSALGDRVCRTVVALGIAVLMVRTAGWSQSARDPMPTYRLAADGRPARVDGRWEVRESGLAGAGIFTGMVRCGDRAFLIDNQARLLRLDLGPGGRLHQLADEDAGLGLPSAIAADCAERRLYVANEGPKTVLVLDAETGALVMKQNYPRALVGVRSVRVIEPGVVELGGVWRPDAAVNLFRETRADAFYDKLRLGVRLALDSGIATPSLLPYERRCLGWNACIDADVSMISGSEGAAWVASQATSTRVGIYDAGGTLLRTNLATSPRFDRDGEMLPENTPAAKRADWMGRNSTIARVFGFGSTVAIVHRLLRTSGWTFGDRARFDVFLNIETERGEGIASDVRLPDVPIGSDDTHLYIVEYDDAWHHAALLAVAIARPL